MARASSDWPFAPKQTNSWGIDFLLNDSPGSVVFVGGKWMRLRESVW